MTKENTKFQGKPIFEGTKQHLNNSLTVKDEM